MDNLLPEKAGWERPRYLLSAPAPGPGSDLHKERTSGIAEGALCVRKLVRRGYNKATLEKRLHSPYFWVEHNFAPAQRNLRESHPVS